jgi:hypothetical protein
MSKLSIQVVPVRPADTATAVAQIAEARANGLLSNRSNPSRMAGILASVLTVMATGRGVEVSDLFMFDDKGNPVPFGKTSAYNLAHRPLSASQIRPHWENVQVVALVRSTITEKSGAKWATITGESSTTAGLDLARVFLVPTE